jgi:ribonuclease D
VQLGREGTLTTVQVSDDNHCFIFDLLVGGEPLLAAGLRALLQSTDVLKVVHDGRRDSDALHRHAGVALAHVFDTQVAFAVLARQEGRGTPLPASLNAVLRAFGAGAVNALKDEAHAAMDADPELWARRPLPPAMLQYAAADVLPLPAVCARMQRALNAQTRAIALARSAEYVAQLRTMDAEAYAAHRATAPAPLRPGVADTGRVVPLYGIPEFDRDVRSSLTRVRHRRVDQPR